ncbi:MAG: hypothetical protein KatS3mg115_2446 [Candidatus Poribacteria bacterium]|nr:MAG: hypothetical protein KatS3mg115_2446 [Candidatus Poribacteria bacterium]
MTYDPVKRVLDRLDQHGCKPTRSGRGYRALCPSHERDGRPHRPSLSIDVGSDGRALIHCFAGCSPEAIVQALGLKLADLMPQPSDPESGKIPPSSRTRTEGPALRPERPEREDSQTPTYSTADAAIEELSRTLGVPANIWPYYDASRRPVGYVLRWNTPEGKEIRPVSRHGSGWRIGAMAEPRPLYHLPLLLDRPEEPVVVVEGEKVAEAAVKCGLVGTTSSGGAQAAHKTDWSPLRGRTVILLPDNDEAGENYAQTVAELVYQAGAASIRIISIKAQCPGLPEGGDLADLIQDPQGTGVPLPHPASPQAIGRWILELAEDAEEWRPSTELDEVPTDLNHSRILTRRLAGRFCWVPAYGWMQYRRGAWHEDPEGTSALASAVRALSDHYLEQLTGEEELDRRRKLLKAAQSVQSRARATAALDLARAALRTDVRAFDAREGLLCAANGVIELETGKLLPHSPSYRFTRQTLAEYDPSAECPCWQRFLEETFLGNEELIEFVQRLLGMALLGGNRERTFVVWWGSGRNGKSTFAGVLREVLGDYVAVAPVGLFGSLGRDDAERATPHLATLPGCRLVTAQEPEARAKLSAGMIKALTGRDVLPARRLYQSPFEFVPQFVPVLVTNHPPELPGTDIALWDRVLMIPFLYRVPDERVDPSLPGRLIQEGPGILRWLVQGAQFYLRQGLRPPEIVRQETARMRAEGDPLYRFLAEELRRDETAATPYRLLRQRYEEWARAEGVEPVSDRAFSSALLKIGATRARSNRQVVYRGITLIEPAN